MGQPAITAGRCRERHTTKRNLTEDNIDRAERVKERMESFIKKFDAAIKDAGPAMAGHLADLKGQAEVIREHAENVIANSKLQSAIADAEKREALIPLPPPQELAAGRLR